MIHGAPPRRPTPMHLPHPRGTPSPMLILALVAWAGAPTSTILPDSAVRGTVSVSLPPSDVKARLADPTWVRSVAGGGTTVLVRSRDGDCVISDYTSPSAVMTVAYTARQCPTADGHKATLMSSPDFAVYETEWAVTPEASGSLLTYTIRIVPVLPFPRSLVTGTLRREVLGMMSSFDRAYGVKTPG